MFEYFSFDKGDVFTVLNEMGNSWLWVKSQTSGEHGQIHGALVEDLVKKTSIKISDLVVFIQRENEVD